MSMKLKLLLALGLMVSLNAFADVTNAQSTSAGVGISGSEASNAGNSQGISFGDTNVENRRIPVSTAYAPPVYPTAPCLGGASGGLQVMGVGITGGGTVKDEECGKLEAARSWDNVPGHVDDAIFVRCTVKYNAEAPSCVALRNKREQDALIDRVPSPLVTTNSNSQAYVERKFLNIQ